MGQEDTRQSPDKTERVELHAGSQAAIIALVERNRQTKFRKKIAATLFWLALLLVTPPTFCSFYCGNIIGTTFETSLLRNYPLATKKIIRSAVIMDGWYLKAFAPLFGGFWEAHEIQLREAVIALGMEETGEGERDREKIRTLREEVGASLLVNPTTAKRALTFAVYEHPPVKKSIVLPPE